MDSGANNNFIDQKFVHEAQIPTLLLDKPVTLQLADGSKSQITKTTAHLKLRIGSHSETIQFLVTNLSRPAILGCSWLKANNPNIDWKSICLNFLGNITVPKLSEAVYPNFKETLTSGTVPLNLPLLLYQQFQEVFSKGKALELPPHRPNFDFQVNLQPNAVPPFSKNYNLTGEEKMEMKTLYTARSILIASNLPLLFYGDAILTATYLHNRIVHTGVTKTPYELCKGRPPRVDHLRPFGCIAYVHIPAETRSKLAPAAIKCRLVGYGDDDDVEEIRGYKFISETDISYVIYSSDARFDESTTPSPLTGYPSFGFSTQGADIFGDPTYSDSEDEEGDGV